MYSIIIIRFNDQTILELIAESLKITASNQFPETDFTHDAANLSFRHRHTCETLNADTLQLYQDVGWPLYKQYGHAFEAFKIIVKDPDAVLGKFTKEVEEEDGSKEKKAKREERKQFGRRKFVSTHI